MGHGLRDLPVPRLRDPRVAGEEDVLEVRGVVGAHQRLLPAEVVARRLEEERVARVLAVPAPLEGGAERLARVVQHQDAARVARVPEGTPGGGGLRHAPAVVGDPLEDVELDWEIPHDVITIWFSDEAGIVGAIPLPQERRWRLIVALPFAEAEAVDHVDPATIPARAEEALYRRAAVSFRRIGDPFWASAFRIHRKLADHFRSGPIFLAGDAAHVHSPVGGQGMNTGIQDAFNLGWKLALAVRDEAAPGSPRHL